MAALEPVRRVRAYQQPAAVMSETPGMEVGISPCGRGSPSSFDLGRALELTLDLPFLFWSWRTVRSSTSASRAVWTTRSRCAWEQPGVRGRSSTGWASMGSLARLPSPLAKHRTWYGLIRLSRPRQPSGGFGPSEAGTDPVRELLEPGRVVGRFALPSGAVRGWRCRCRRAWSSSLAPGCELVTLRGPRTLGRPVAAKAAKTALPWPCP